MTDKKTLPERDRKVMSSLLRGKSMMATAEKLGISYSTVKGIANRLVRDGHIAKTPGTYNPISFHDPARVIIRRNSVQANEGYVTPNPSSKDDPTATIRAHLHGQYVVPVSIIGNFDHVVDKKGNKVQLFPVDTPSLDHNRCKEWHASLYLDHEWVPLSFWQSPNKQILKVYPSEIWTEPTNIEKIPAMFISKVQNVCKILSEQGWVFDSDPVLSGKIFYAVVDPDITEHFEDMAVIPDIPGQTYDASTGINEVELDNVEKAKILAQAGLYLKAHDLSIDSINKKLAGYDEKFATLTSANRELRIEVLESENFMLERQAVAYEIMRRQVGTEDTLRPSRRVDGTEAMFG